MTEDPLTIIPADMSELSSTSVDGSGHLYNRDKIAKASVSINDGETSPVLSVRQFYLNGNNIIIFSDLCQVVLKTWGSYNNLYNLLKKHGIGTCRFDHFQLRWLKNSGFVNLQVKNCSFIIKKDFYQILHKYDEDNNTDCAKRIQLSSPITMNNLTTTNPQSQGGKKYCNNDILAVGRKTSSQSSGSSIHNTYTYFSTDGDQDFVTLSEAYRLFETKFRRPDLLNLVLHNLKIDVCKLTANEMARVDTNTGVICSDDTLRELYITREDFEQVLQYTSALLDTSPTTVSSGHLEALSTSMAKKGNNTEAHNSAGFVSNSSSTTSETPVLSDTGNFLESGIAKESSSATSCVIRTCLVEGEVVVCVPDLRKVVIDLYGQSVQVGSLMHRLGIPTHRFSSMILKHLKGHNILSSRATLCTYITKADAERLLKMYHMCNRSENQSEDPPRIEWSEPIILANDFNATRGDHLASPQLQQCVQAELKVPLFIINQQVVVAMPDVHRAVQLLNGNSVQLRYNLDKLGIVKHKYSYTDVLHLKVLGHINRPSVCTYITRADFDVLLQFYTTSANEYKLKLIELQEPVVVERMESNSDSTFSSGAGEEVHDEDETNKDQVDEYSISDLYKVFVGDDLDSTQSSQNNTDDNLQEQISQCKSPPASVSILPSSQLNIVNPDSDNEAVSDECQESTMTYKIVSPSLSDAGSFSIAELVTHPGTAVSSHVSSVSPQPSGTPDGGHVCVKAVEGEEHSKNISPPATSVFLVGIRPTVDSPKGVSKETHTITGTHVVHPSPSLGTILPASGLRDAHLGVITHRGITERVPSIPTDYNIHSTCATTASRYGVTPSVGLSPTSCGKILVCNLDLVV